MTVQPDFMVAHSSDTGKMMGLSAFGKYDAATAAQIRASLDEFNKAHESGVSHLHRQFGLDETYSRLPDKGRRDFAATVQKEWEEELLGVAERFRSYSTRIALVGGCALNVVANGRLANSGLFSDIYIPAVASDSGQSLGALWSRYPNSASKSAYLGRHHGVDATVGAATNIAQDLISGRVVALYTGRSEAGPRALGNRSILALPRNTNVRRRVSEEIKGREYYRPIAPVVRAEDLTRFFRGTNLSPYMSYAYPVTSETQERAPAVVHNDGTARVQTVTREQHSVLHAVLSRLEEEGEAPILANTSLNIAGSPIVDTPKEALDFLRATDVDVLYLGDERIEKRH